MALNGSIKVIAGRTTPAVPLSVAKDFLRVEQDFVQEDSLILGMVDAATDLFERRTRRSFIYQTFRYTFDAFPAGPIELPRSPCVSMAIGGAYTYATPRIRYYNGAGVLTSMTEGTDYQLDLDNLPPLIHFPAGACLWPIAQLLRRKAVEVDFVAGFGASHTDVPQLLRQGILMVAAYWYENRSAIGQVSGDLEDAVSRIARIYSDGSC